MPAERSIRSMITAAELARRAAREMPFIREDEIEAIRAEATLGAAASRALLAGEPTYTMFVGYPRSGHSLVGSLLDAHPDVVIAHELDALRFLQAGFTRDEIYYLILENSRLFAEIGRTWGPYSYAVPDQWQGRFRTLRVIGDKKGGRSTRHIHDDPSSLDRASERFGSDIRLIHVVRDPFDNVASMARTMPSQRHAAESYFSLCETVQRLVRRLPPSSLMTIPYARFVEDVPTELARACTFLGVDPLPDYLEACARIVFPSPKRARDSFVWDPAVRELVDRRRAEFDFLRG
jgi:Sulfotransferase family